ncbi:hypothetical protein B4N89_20760 [Embleya scabrispora]|uniref:DNA helicase DnaB-like N-terminal domain-containing protein n=1 Tax=Embleya scabrispora TaxID=159449 RepID=A0A1T3P1R4_9ACTN|nr:DnaB-like helicase N-terminal domain-containing protein [Embleya scabrispora]OPC83046.1 hypothetical protein B4N89_20760 [Embleya scabrispora]
MDNVHYLREDEGPLTRLPPHDIDAEMRILGLSMYDPAEHARAAALMDPGDFYRAAHETLWRALSRLHAEGTPTDPIALNHELTRSGDIKRVGGAPYLHTVYSQAAVVGQAEYYAAIIHEHAEIRSEIALGTRLMQNGHSPDHDRELAGKLITSFVEKRTAATLDVAHPWAPLDLTDVVAGKQLNAAPEFLQRDDGESLLYAGKIHSVSGESESGKTWLLLLACAQLIGAGGVVLYLDFEDSAEGIVGRLMALGIPADLILQGLRYCRPDIPIDDAARSVIGAVIERDRPGLCVVDGVTEAMNLHGLDPLDNKGAAQFYEAVPRFVARKGPAVAMIDHVVKDAEKRGRYAMGAQHKLAGIDGAAYLVEPIKPFGYGAHGISRVRVAKDRPGRVREHAVGAVIGDLQMFSSEDRSVRVELRSPRPYDGPPGSAGGTHRPTALMEKVSRIVEETPGLSKASLEALTGGKREAVRAAMELLVREGFVVVEKGERNALVHRSARPYREAPDAS